MQIGLLIVRTLVLMAATAAGFALAHALGLHRPNNLFLGGAGFLAGVLVVLLEWQARRIPVDRLFWGATGAMLGVVLGLGLGTAVEAVVPGAGALGRGLFALLLGYLGAMVTLAKRDDLEDMSVKLFPKTAVGRQEGDKILDTSVIIDGRIVDVCQTGFLAGTLLVPQFVLRELQQIADSADALRRNRGKRGFDVLQRLQRVPRVSVRIDEVDFPQVREVDRKLIELARATGGKIVTNDYNLNRVAELSGRRGAQHQRARQRAQAGGAARRAAARPHRQGRQGSEPGRRLSRRRHHGGGGARQAAIGQTVDVTVTTIYQTAAGRMIFARQRDEESAPR